MKEDGSAEAAEEALEPDPSADTAGEEDEDAEPEAEPWKKVRDDLYRRQSRLEERLNQSTGQIERATRELNELMLRQGAVLAGKGSDTPQPVMDPMTARLKLNQDPVGFFRQIVQEELKQSESRVEGAVASKLTESETRRELYSKFPELNDSGHPFFEAADRIYRDLTVQGLPGNIHTSLAAARLAAAERPELREQSLKDRRRGQSREKTNGSLAETLRVEKGVTKPKPKDEGLPTLDENVARGFFGERKWEEKKKDPKALERMRKDQATLNKMRVPTKAELAKSEE